MFWLIVVVMSIAALALVLYPMFKSNLKKETLLIIALVIVVPLSGLVGYEIGSYEKLPAKTPPVSEGTAAGEISPAPDPAKMVAQLETRLKSSGGTPDEWAMLARSYVTLQRHKEAVSAYAKATESIQNDAQMYADYADALAMSKGGLDKESEALIDKALTVDPLNPKALALKATVAFNNKDYQAAIDRWQKMLTAPGLEKAWATSARSSIEEARGLLHPDRKN